MSSAGSAGTSGEAFLSERLAQLARRMGEGEACEVVFDLDNTLFDTRTRTAQVARAFDEQNGTHLFDSLTLDDVGLDAEETCARLGKIPPDQAEAFERFWKEAFWDGSALVYDTPVEPVLDWARRARSAGAKVRFLTGRIEALRPATEQQLARVGFGDGTRRSLWMKPDVATWTLSFKESRLHDVMKRAWLGWYATEGRNEIAHLQRELPGGPWVLVDCSLQKHGPPVDADTPVLRRVF